MTSRSKCLLRSARLPETEVTGCRAAGQRSAAQEIWRAIGSERCCDSDLPAKPRCDPASGLCQTLADRLWLPRVSSKARPWTPSPIAAKASHSLVTARTCGYSCRSSVSFSAMATSLSR